MSKGDKTEIDAQIAASIKDFSRKTKGKDGEPARIEMPPFIQQKAAMISAHFLLPAGSRVVDMGCGRGEITYTLALLNPRLEFVGVDRDPASIAFAKKHLKLPNLAYHQTDISLPDFADASVDAIINSNVLHGIYSAAGYNTEDVMLLLEKQWRKLKTGGTMLIRDYIMPQEEMVLLELPVGGDADLLVRFSQTARPLPGGGSEGFFIQELQPKRDATRLFRLPHKWAVEFIHRKNDRANWDKEIGEELTFFTWQDYRRACARVGLRMIFSAPYSNPWVVKNLFKGKFQLYTETYQPLGFPPTNHFIVTQKVEDKQSLVLEERRPSQVPGSELQVVVVKDKKTGALLELVRRPGEHCDIVPYRITPDNRLIVFVRGGSPRPIVNAVARGSYNLDGKKWSGHLIEPVTMDTETMVQDAEDNRKSIFDYVRGLGLRPKSEDSWWVGDTYFPAPDIIDEAIEPVFIEVENPAKTSWNLPDGSTIVELDGADILLSSQVGLLPEPRLEMHVFALMARYGIPFPKWVGEGLPDIPREKIEAKPLDDIIGEEEKEFEDVKTAPAHVKAVKAVFVDEGKVGASTRGLAARDLEFIVTDDGIENVAVVLPLTRDWDNNLLVALSPQVLPTPNRIGGGNGAMLSAPSFILPRDVKTVDDARAFIAQKFKVEIDQVTPMGESYFRHVGLTPQRVYPFTVVSAKEADDMDWGYCMLDEWYFADQTKVRRATADLIKLVSRVQMQVNRNSDASMGLEQKYKGYSVQKDRVALNGGELKSNRIPSRILGERGPMHAAAPPPKAAGGKLSQSFSLKPTAATENVDRNADKVARALKSAELDKFKP